MALGDVTVFLTFGPVSVMFAFLGQAGRISFTSLLYAIPLVLHIIGILHANNTRDMDSDKKANIFTVAILLGRTGSYLVFTILIFLPYLMLFQCV
ncbi:hypothetical protein DPMN_108195 [Dreissena polymorpha]|uniref:Uncharacterized protein n=1 Tax=Dreissena polymorpha TaxID=45954 RepID=A0A9D4K828_DREPO|nr:hypothetical protein DPMN_108195 [Dreissena polymorpha]